MDTQGGNTGSFGAAAGGMSPALQQVLGQVKSGQYKLPATSQVTNGAPGAESSQQPPMSPTGAAPMPPMGVPPTATADTAGAPQPMPFESPEAMMILKSFDSRLKSLSKQDELKLQPQGGF